MNKRYKVWIEVEECDPQTESYATCGEPLDLPVATEAAGHTLAAALHAIGGDLQAHFPRVGRPAD